jgi:hypothetical protein
MPIPELLQPAIGGLAIVVGLGLVALFVPWTRPPLGWLWRLVTGGLVLVRPGPWDSKWLYPAPSRASERPMFRGEHYPRTRWGRMPGYQRMGVRWAVVGYLVLLTRWPHAVVAASAAVAVALTVRRLLRLIKNWAIRSVAGLFAAGAAPLLGYEGRDPATWIAVPRLRLVWVPIPVAPALLRLARRLSERLEHGLGRLAVPVLRVPLDDDDARVRIALDAEITHAKLIEDVRELAEARLPEGPWAAAHRQRDLTIELRHPKRPPAAVWYTAEVNQRYAIDDVPIGQSADDWVTLPLKKLTPHTIVAASTGWGKTTIANVYIGHTAGNGGFVLVNDPKRIGYIRAFGELPNVRIASSVDGWVSHVDAFNAEMQRRYEIIEQHPEIADDPEQYFQPWFLVTDERGSYVSEVKAWWKRLGEKGMPEPFRTEKLNLWQARAAAMYILDLAQQANLDVFLDSDGRDNRMARIAAGPQTRSSWMMLFPGNPKVKTLMRKGRAMLGIGPDHITEIQLAQVSTEDARAFAAAGAAIADRENKARAERLSALLGMSVSTVDSLGFPGGTPVNVPGPRMDGQARRYDDEHGRPSMSEIINENAGESVRPNLSVVKNDTENDGQNDGEPPIVGLQAAADYLGMGKESFEKARQRRAVPGEFRQGSQPAWPPLALTEWRAQAPRAGRTAGAAE